MCAMARVCLLVCAHADDAPPPVSANDKARELDDALAGVDERPARAASAPKAAAKKTKKTSATASTPKQSQVAKKPKRKARDEPADESLSSSESSSLSVGDVDGDEFDTLKQSISAGVERDAKKQARKREKAAAKKKAAAAASSADKDLIPDLQPAVVYVGHLPWGLEERQLRGFFSQFGEIGRVKVARNKRTGRSRHFAFVEFMRLHVARTVCDVMDGYIMFRRRLVCT